MSNNNDIFAEAVHVCMHMLSYIIPVKINFVVATHA